MFLKFKPFLAPAQEVFKDPDSGHMFSGKTRGELVGKLVNYRAQNGLPQIEKLRETIDNYQCNLPINMGKCEPMKLTRGWVPTIKGGVALLLNLMYNSFASQEVADKRAKQCKSCKFNVFLDRTKFIKWADSMAENSVGDRKSLYHEDLGNCAVCSCPLRAKVFYNEKIELPADQIEKMKTVDCWQLKELK